MADTRPAWLMDVGGGVTVAAGTAHVAEFLVEAEPVPIPRTPAHCAGVMVWRERLIPVVDLARLLTGRSASGPYRHAVILAYQQAAGRPLQYGALFVTGAPAQTQVSDDMACALPDAQPALPHIARACFSHQDRAVAILDPRRLFDRPVPATTAPEADAEPLMARHDAGEPARVIDADQLAERRRERAAAEVVPYLHIVASTAPVAVEPARPAPTDDHGGESPHAPPEAVAAELIDIEWQAAFDSVVEPAPADAVDELPAVEDASPTVDTAAPATAPPESTAAARAGANAVAASTRAASNTMRSFERLHDLERRHTPTERRRGWWLLAVGVAVVLLVIGVWSLTATNEAPTADASKAQETAMARDAAALAVQPASIPSTPAQPPK